MQKKTWAYAQGFLRFFQKKFYDFLGPKKGRFSKKSWTLARVLRPPIGIYPAKIARFPHFLQNAAPFYQKSTPILRLFCEFSRFWGIIRARKPRKTGFYCPHFLFSRKLEFAVFVANPMFSLKCSFLQKSHFR